MDIVKQLRSVQELLGQAAGEIERLRALIEQYKVALEQARSEPCGH